MELKLSNVQENDLVRHFDLDTGEELTHSVIGAISAEISALSAEAEHLKSLKAHPGWKLVEQYIAEASGQATKELILSGNLTEIQRLQEFIKAYQSVLSWVDAKIFEAAKASEQLSSDDAAAL